MRKKRDDLLEQADHVLTDLGQANNDIVGVDVTEGGMVTTLSPRLIQHQVPAVYRRQQVLVFPEKTGKILISYNESKPGLYRLVVAFPC